MLSSDIPAYELSPIEKATMIAALVEKVPRYHVYEYRQFVARCADVENRLSPGFTAWRDRARHGGFGLLRNLPIDGELPPTPTIRHAADNLPLIADALVGVVCGLFGTLYTFGSKTTNRHIHNVYPIAGDENTQLGSSKNELEWHVEDGFHPMRPDWVVLFCLRSDPHAATRLARAADLRFPAEILERLHQKRFVLRIDDSFSSDMHGLYIPTAILNGRGDDLEIVYDPAYTRRDDPMIDADLAVVKNEANRVQISVTLSAGELLVFNNRRAVHARTAYEPRADGTDRWLKRALVLDRQRPCPEMIDGVMPFSLTA